MSINYHYARLCYFSGIAGRRTYLEQFGVGNTATVWSDDKDSDLNRFNRMVAVWNCTDEDQFRKAMPANVTHVVEYTRQPLGCHSPRLMRSVWISPKREVVIWELVRS
jgi:hypothetical protein